MLFSDRYSSIITEFNTSDGSIRQTIEQESMFGSSYKVYGAVYSPDGSTILAYSRNGQGGTDARSAAYIFDSDSGILTTTVPIGFGTYYGHLDAFSFGSSNDHFLTGSPIVRQNSEISGPHQFSIVDGSDQEILGLNNLRSRTPISSVNGTYIASLLEVHNPERNPIGSLIFVTNGETLMPSFAVNTTSQYGAMDFTVDESHLLYFTYDHMRNLEIKGISLPDGFESFAITLPNPIGRIWPDDEKIKWATHGTEPTKLVSSENNVVMLLSMYVIWLITLEL